MKIAFAALLICLAAPAWAQQAEEPLETYVYATPGAASPYPSSLFIPAAPSGTDSTLLHIPASAFATLSDTQSLSNKTLVSPALTGTPTAPTAAPGTDTDQIATTAFVAAAGGGGSVTQGTVPWVMAPQPGTTTMAAVSVATANIFQTVLAASASRKGCAIQYTGATIGYVYFGAIGGASKAASFQLTPGASINCGTPSVVLTDNVSVTSATGGDTFVVSSQ